MGPILPTGDAGRSEEVRRGLGRARERSLRAFESIAASGLPVKPSDDPTRAARLETLAAAIDRADVGSGAVDRGLAVLDAAERGVRDIRGLLTDGLRIVSAAENGPAGGSELAGLQAALNGVTSDIDAVARGTRSGDVLPLVDDPALGQSGPVTVRTSASAGEVALPFRSDFRPAALLGPAPLDLSTAAGRSAARASLDAAVARADESLAASGGASGRLLQAREAHGTARAAAQAEAAALGGDEFLRAILEVREAGRQEQALGTFAKRTLGLSAFDTRA